MSLDVYLSIAEPKPAEPHQAIFVRRGGANVEITRSEWDAINPGVEPVTATVNADDADKTEVYSGNITHNLNKMAAEAGIYDFLWHPDEIGITKAVQLIEPLTAGLALLRGEPDRFRKLNPENGWGNYEGLVVFVDRYLAACQQYPTAAVSVCR
jgi:hypothetical protein